LVTLAPHLAELVCAAAGCDTLVAVGAYSDYPPEVKALPVIGDVAQVNLEALMALAPTQVLAWDGGTPAAQLAKLRALHLPVTALRIAHIEDVPQALETVGALLGTGARAKAAAEDFRRRLAAVSTRAAAGRAPLRVLYQIETAPVYSVNRDSPISEAITRCGGVNVFADLPTLAAPVTDEAVLAAQPQVVVHAPADTAAVAAYWARFAKAARVQPRRIAIDPDLLARAGPRLVQGLEQLCAALDALPTPAP
jgi:ABC-type hemin transport system substrate-binding protein